MSDIQAPTPDSPKSFRTSCHGVEAASAELKVMTLGDERSSTSSVLYPKTIPNQVSPWYCRMQPIWTKKQKISNTHNPISKLGTSSCIVIVWQVASKPDACCHSCALLHALSTAFSEIESLVAQLTSPGSRRKNKAKC